jgi:hypothetical protein
MAYTQTANPDSESGFLKLVVSGLDQLLEDPLSPRVAR